ncbi:DIE2/ALG10 family protein [Coccidioides posadasii C735 delta SOWgp]|uniref:Dol-P-Glc:Glc(2)Man(9)GlcNAc(2)-PP-Dol alpha-1,2-glucosyltransferase n=1 Tax=Coccidioides posadasii (strain C735) TaxID=222929 RepID=C5PJ51_COCP7|nr:DIE2/ALG10 family protein [Coccidioides posadasii C735 delta SOWgp]EER23000.1 DIE2/ALG10 family protein [Coccidioides posadasii C735 delta SOWgp]|eukprot:XP_003065145.1 DIE2/ALG10 family protein [Coccidioides posadasii C735 delta SOWgp]
MTGGRPHRHRTLVKPTRLTALILSTCISYWLYKVNTIVPDPYLDEVFHVRQAQAYWRHQWREWDPKITTPPGLYLLSYVVAALGFVISRKPAVLTAAYLRCANGFILLNILPIVLKRLMKHVRGSSGAKKGVSAERQSGWEFTIVALNICLFPPIFFFSGLYYTDLASLLIVLEVYRRDLESANGAHLNSQNALSSHHSILLFLFGLVSLLFRQTNIFWSAVFLGGLQVVKMLHSLSVDAHSSDITSIMKSSWGLRQVYDPLVREAFFEDYLKACLSIGIAAAVNTRVIFVAFLPYISLLGAFGMFVLWNGSVVLGHKEFHTAGLHVPQMLYIWAYFMFFSWPVMVAPWVLALQRAFSSKNGMRELVKSLPRLSIAACFVVMMLLAVHFNTIVHPFTLADNRHYVFYVFRMLLRKPFIKYAVTPVYFLCGWASISAFGAGTSTAAEHQPGPAPMKYKKAVGPALTEGTADSPNSLHSKRDDPTDGVRVSFVIVWLASTTLCLITAPLVEPRYFIIPWVLWRLHIPSSIYSLQLSRSDNINASSNEASKQLIRYLPLIIEGVWFLIVNAVTGYMFLYRGFEWPQEPGKVQRFMW